MNEKLIYLDNAATSWPKPEGVYTFMVDFYRGTGVNPGRSGYDLALEAGSLLDRLRKRLTKFFGGDQDAPERLCFGYNATDALSLIIAGLLAPGDHVITTHLEHNSVIRPINHLVRDGGVTATFVPFDGAGFVDPADIARAIRPNTKLVVVNHGSNVIGTVQPVKEIGRICREHGVTFAVDGFRGRSGTSGSRSIFVVGLGLTFSWSWRDNACLRDEVAFSGSGRGEGSLYALCLDRNAVGGSLTVGTPIQLFQN